MTKWMGFIAWNRAVRVLYCIVYHCARSFQRLLAPAYAGTTSEHTSTSYPLFPLFFVLSSFYFSLFCSLRATPLPVNPAVPTLHYIDTHNSGKRQVSQKATVSKTSTYQMPKSVTK